jgi:hypothetical protein
MNEVHDMGTRACSHEAECNTDFEISSRNREAADDILSRPAGSAKNHERRDGPRVAAIA